MKVVAVAGGFDPLHEGHIDHLKAARSLGDKLIVILNPDSDLMRKKGYALMTFENRRKVLKAIRYVDEVVEAIDGDGTVAKTLEKIRPNIFAKGGDRVPANMPVNEVDVCKRINCKIVYNVGGTKKSSSSQLVGAVMKKWYKQMAEIAREWGAIRSDIEEYEKGLS